MAKALVDLLANAEGRSEFVIVVVADIRGFSAFSTRHEAPDIAMFIKRFYLRLINNYFPSSSFVKPTGDGLLMTFTYAEKSLFTVAGDVIEACLRCLVDFPTLCKDDPMINFSYPAALGFGIARGTACCLYSGKDIIDYSGHLLNLASRLNDLARPSGIVIDGAFMQAVIPEDHRSSFKTQMVYVRSIAEEEPMPVLYLDQYVKISDAALTPLVGENWRTSVLEFSMQQLLKLGPRFRHHLPTPARSKADITITLITRRTDMPKVSMYYSFKDFDYQQEGAQSLVIIHMDKVQERVTSLGVRPRTKVQLRLEYIPRPLPRA